jgi:anaerobic selenocysteine-containing dehydrogenase
MMLRLGPYGDGFGADPGGLTLQRLLDAPHGVDLGPPRPRLPEVLRTPSGQVELAPLPLVADTLRLREALDRRADGLLLIGRRQLRSNNSWMHLPGGTNRCTLQIHPDDAAGLGLTDVAVVKGPGGELLIPVEVTDGIRPGVVSIPHGWAEANVNRLNDGSVLDPLSSTSVLNGIPVEVSAVDPVPSG